MLRHVKILTTQGKRFPNVLNSAKTVIFKNKIYVAYSGNTRKNVQSLLCIVKSEFCRSYQKYFKIDVLACSFEV